MKHITDKSCTETQKHTFYVLLRFFSFEKVPFMRQCGKMVPQMIWRMRIACWITKAKNTHSQNVILTAYLLQQWLHGRTSM